MKFITSPLAPVGLFVIFACVVGGAILIKDHHKHTLAQKNPPARTYSGEEVEIPKLGDCITASVGGSNLAALAANDVHEVSVIRENLRYRACNSEWGCGWRWDLEAKIRFSDRSASKTIKLATDYAYPASPFGLRLVLETDHVRAFLPVDAVHEEESFAAACKAYSQEVLQTTVNAIQWTPTHPRR